MLFEFAFSPFNAIYYQSYSDLTYLIKITILNCIFLLIMVYQKMILVSLKVTGLKANTTFSGSLGLIQIDFNFLSNFQVYK